MTNVSMFPPINLIKKSPEGFMCAILFAFNANACFDVTNCQTTHKILLNIQYISICHTNISSFCVNICRVCATYKWPKLFEII